MSASNEWTDFHLTKNGWVRGSDKMDFAGVTEVVPPDNVLLTRRYKEYLASVYSSMEFTYSDTICSSDSDLIESTLVEYPPLCPGLPKNKKSRSLFGTPSQIRLIQATVY